MIILNTTFHLHKSIEPEVIGWIKRTYAAAAIKGGASPQYLLTRILPAEPDPEAAGYALHLTFDSLEAARHWNDSVGQSLRNIMAKRWGEKALTFHTYLEIVN